MFRMPKALPAALDIHEYGTHVQREISKYFAAVQKYFSLQAEVDRNPNRISWAKKWENFDKANDEAGKLALLATSFRYSGLVTTSNKVHYIHQSLYKTKRQSIVSSVQCLVLISQLSRYRVGARSQGAWAYVLVQKFYRVGAKGATAIIKIKNLNLTISPDIYSITHTVALALLHQTSTIQVHQTGTAASGTE